MNTPLMVSALYISSLKSGKITFTEQSAVTRRGLLHDRFCIVVDEDGCMLTQRELPRMVLIEADFHGTDLTLRTPGLKGLAIRRSIDQNCLRQVDIFKKKWPGIDQGDQASEWLSAFLERKCRLLFQAPYCDRSVSSRYGLPGEEVSYADSAPITIALQSSLTDLNDHLPTGVPSVQPEAVRVNIWIKGEENPFADDHWGKIRIGNHVVCRIPEGHKRCEMTNIDPTTGEVRADGEPWRTLKSYRHNRFSQKAVPITQGPINVGDPVVIVESR